MSINLDALLREAVRMNPAAAEAIKEWRAAGVTPTIVLTNHATGEVIGSSNDDDFDDLLDLGFDVQSVLTLDELRDVAQADPLAPAAVRNDSAAKAAHAAEVRDMLTYLIGVYRTGAMSHPEFDGIIDGVVAALYRTTALKALTSCATVYERWDMVLTVALDALLEEFA